LRAWRSLSLTAALLVILASLYSRLHAAFNVVASALAASSEAAFLSRCRTGRDAMASMRRSATVPTAARATTSYAYI
jgi:hypothetical protein